MRLAVIGCGRIAQLFHIRTLEEDARCRLVALCDKDEALVKALARVHGSMRYYTDYEVMLKEESLDAVLVCTPPHSHTQIAVDCAESGLHAFIEKPLAVTVAKCRKVVQASETNRVQVMVGFMKRFHHGLQWLRKLLASKRLGDPMSILLHYHDSTDPRSVVRRRILGSRVQSPGLIPNTLNHLLLSRGIHHLDLAVWLGGSADSVRALYWRRGRESSIYSVAQLQSAFMSSQVCRGFPPRWREEIFIHGTEGSAVASFRHPYTCQFSKVEVLIGSEKHTRTFRTAEAFQAELRSFVSCLMEGRKVSPSAHESLESQKLADMVIRSVKRHRQVRASYIRGDLSAGKE